MIMANWIENKIVAEGIAHLDIYTGCILDFNKVIPEPTEQKDCQEQYWLTTENKNNIELDKDKPWFDWYQWRKKHWGVHTNADMTECDKTENEILFCTKWNAPYPVIAHISKMLGVKPLTHTCIDLDKFYDDVIKTVWVDGKMVHAYKSQFQYEQDPHVCTNENDGKYGEFTPIDTSDEYDV